MSIKDRTSHLMVMLPVQMIEEIDEYQQENRLRTRHETIRALIKIGLEQNKAKD